MSDHPMTAHCGGSPDTCEDDRHEDTWDAVGGLQFAVEQLAKAMPALVDACTSPDASDMANLLLDVREARVALYGLEQDLEAQLAKAMMGDDVAAGGVRAERYRARDRKAWDHDAWQRDVRAKVLRSTGLLGAQAVITADGEELPASVLYDALTAAQAVHGAGAPKTTILRKLGLAAEDYCETSPGTQHVRVFRLAEGDE